MPSKEVNRKLDIKKKALIDEAIGSASLAEHDECIRCGCMRGTHPVKWAHGTCDEFVSGEREQGDANSFGLNKAQQDTVKVDVHSFCGEGKPEFVPIASAELTENPLDALLERLKQTVHIEKKSQFERAVEIVKQAYEAGEKARANDEMQLGKIAREGGKHDAYEECAELCKEASKKLEGLAMDIEASDIINDLFKAIKNKIN